MHIHGFLSSDSALDYHELCKKACELNYTSIAFTEHFDLLDTEILEYGILSLNKYFILIDKLRKEFPEINIIKGIELGEPHRVKEISDRLFKIEKPEYIIGSLHVTKKNLNVSTNINRILTINEVENYYQENLDMVQQGGFDTLGHLSIYKRSIPYNENYPKKRLFYIIDEIFREMIKKNICLEINFSSFFRNCISFLPEPELLVRYRDMGGDLITIGSDSHQLEHFDKFYNKTLDSLRLLKFRCIWWKLENKWYKLDL